MSSWYKDNFRDPKAYWPDDEGPLNIFSFFEESPDILPPKDMQDIPRYSRALYQAGHVEWSDFFLEYYDRLCKAIEEEVTVMADA